MIYHNATRNPRASAIGRSAPPPGNKFQRRADVRGCCAVLTKRSIRVRVLAACDDENVFYRVVHRAVAGQALKLKLLPSYRLYHLLTFSRKVVTYISSNSSLVSVMRSNSLPSSALSLRANQNAHRSPAPHTPNAKQTRTT